MADKDVGKPRGGKGGVSGLGRGSGSGGGGRQGRGEGASLRAGGLEPSIQDSSVWGSGQARLAYLLSDAGWGA